MSALSNVHATSLLNTSLRSGTYYLALFLTDPTASGNGTEVSGGGYARKIITFGTPSLVSGKEQVTNSAHDDRRPRHGRVLGHLRCTVKRQSALVRLVFAQQERVERRRNHGFDGGNRLYAVIRGQDHV